MSISFNHGTISADVSGSKMEDNFNNNISILMKNREKKKLQDQCNEYIKQALESSRKLIILADEGEAHSVDDGCAVLYGVVRDCAYKIRAEAEREKQVHIENGKWDTSN